MNNKFSNNLFLQGDSSDASFFQSILEIEQKTIVEDLFQNLCNFKILKRSKLLLFTSCSFVFSSAVSAETRLRTKKVITGTQEILKPEIKKGFGKISEKIPDFLSNDSKNLFSFLKIYFEEQNKNLLPIPNFFLEKNLQLNIVDLVPKKETVFYFLPVGKSSIWGSIIGNIVSNNTHYNLLISLPIAYLSIKLFENYPLLKIKGGQTVLRIGSIFRLIKRKNKALFQFLKRNINSCFLILKILFVGSFILFLSSPTSLFLLNQFYEKCSQSLGFVDRYAFMQQRLFLISRHMNELAYLSRNFHNIRDMLQLSESYYDTMQVLALKRSLLLIMKKLSRQVLLLSMYIDLLEKKIY